MKLKNAHQNNLKNINLELPENQLIVVTGLSGSGKSSLAMGVIANEGYRYFLESLAAYNQQNALAIPTAEVDEIDDLLPVIKVEQSKRFQSINTTFGTLSELTAIFRILFARYSGEDIMSKSLFSFNHPKGACEVCRGIGEAEFIDLNKLIGDENKTLREGAITTTLPGGYIVYSQVTVEELNKVCEAHGFNVDIPWKELSEEQKDVILNGSERIKVYYGKHSLESRLRWEGFKAKPREEHYYKGMLPIMNDILKRDRNPNILKFVSSKLCPSCKGARIKAEHLKYKWKDYNFQEWMEMPLNPLFEKLKDESLNEGEKLLVDKILIQLNDLIQLGMEDYSMSIPSTEISSGDAQRIKLIKQVNSNLQGILYVFDEPSIGLAAPYQEYLLYMLKRLIKKGNTVMVVEHDLNFIEQADWILELGPKAGRFGGDVIFNGSLDKFLNSKNIDSPTLNEIQKSVNNKPLKPNQNTKQILNFQPGSLNVISRKTEDISSKLKDFANCKDYNMVRVTDQPIGKTPRSNPATYTALADKLRDLFAKTEKAKTLNLKKGAFSFNNKMGRCETCEGAGVISLSMSVMGNINQTCPSCNGKRFKPEVLQVEWQNKNIADVYNLSVEQALDFFSEEKAIAKVLELMIQLGLGYLKLGQPSNTLSGGEAQRIKLTKHFAKPTRNSLLILEEPSIGLHQQNVRQLLEALHQLKKQTAGIICFENHALFHDECDQWIDNSIPFEKRELAAVKQDDTKSIHVKGANTHHLKDLNIVFPKNKLSVLSGISGSGKSSLLIDTLHGYGLQEMTKQFSSYQQSRVGVNFQFEVENITGLSPTICISRKEKSENLRSDIAKQTGIDKLLRFAFSRKAQYEGDELSASHFSNHHELGRCAICEGVGVELLPDLEKIIHNENLSIAEGLFTHNKALAYYGEPDSRHMAIFEELAKANGFSTKTPFKEFNEEQRRLLFEGAGDKVWETEWRFKTKTRSGTQQVSMRWEGLFHYLKDEYYKTRKNKHIDNLKALFSPATCGECSGSGLKKERLDYKLEGKSIQDVKEMNFNELDNWLSQSLGKNTIDYKLINRFKPYLEQTIERAKQLHINHLQLSRKSPSLSGGENQRVELIKQLNSPLKGITYLLDEPSAGLSVENIPDLIKLLKELIDKGNTVIVIEHNKEIILAADQLVELGPKAGKLGGEIIFQGTPQSFLKQDCCHPYLKTAGKKLSLKTGGQAIQIKNINRYSLKKEKLNVPIGGITAISGKSGIGKTTLVKDIIIPSINIGTAVHCSEIDFPRKYKAAQYFEAIKLRAYNNTLVVDYLDLLSLVIKVFAKNTDLKTQEFSYKNKKGQCPNCKGRGVIETSLDIAANTIETCEVCKGTRYQQYVLDYKVDGLNIAEVLDFNLAELNSWFAQHKVSSKKISFLDKMSSIGLDHLTLNQPVKSLSSGEKQRLLLLNCLEDQTENTLYVLDEPSIGLHFEDIDLLFDILEKLSRRNDIVVIDHNPYLLEKIGVGVVLK
ncbi:AAA family ATPase [Marivirga arenosa]|uniref:UvrABC system protein A n=1 Tax=Marivirga arenosa TaxID=3059076 RepID=A0AA51X3I1_9BACT|nr:AAA family ATPase [Marivirga sp. BKB1-2]WNB17062.1 ATP-binding cassette domain-containing protein [Marivirga sp. BKB1-2]